MSHDVAEPFEIRVHTNGGTAVLELYGEFDLATAEEAADAFAEVVESGPTTIVVNLHNLEFMDSSGVKCLYQAKGLADQAGIRLAILNASGAPRRLLSLINASGAFEIVDDVESLADPPVAPTM
jgi:anti-anti-sigma factor